MRSSLAESLDKQLESYRAIARRRPRAGERGQDGGHWMRFAAAAGASLVGAATVEAAITRVVPSPIIHINVYPGGSTTRNLDGGADNDLYLAAGSVDPYPYNGYRYMALASGLNNAALVGGASAGPFAQIEVRKFAADDTIPAVAPTASGSLLHVSATSFGALMTYAGQWGIDGTGFAGFVNGVGTASVRAGWIKIRVVPLSGRLGAVEILEWAYESVPGVSIKAGQTTSALPIPGDYNNSGTVGPEDYTVWKNTFNQTVAAGTGADGNSSGRVDAADYSVWRDNLGRSNSGSAAISIPEPSTVTLGVLALGAAGVAALRRRSP